MALVIAAVMANGQVIQMAASAFAQWSYVLQRGASGQNMFSTDPAGHLAMELARHGFVNLVAGKAQAAHRNCPQSFCRRAKVLRNFSTLGAATAMQ